MSRRDSKLLAGPDPDQRKQIMVLAEAPGVHPALAIDPDCACLIESVKNGGRQRSGSGSDDKRFHAELPDTVRAQLPPGSEVRYCIESDMDREGRFEPSYLVLTEDRVFGFDRGDSAPVDVKLSMVKNARAEELFGGGRVLVECDGKEIALISYSRDRVPEFAAATRVIDDLAHDRPVVLPELEGPSHSERSGAPLPERGARSPLDVPRWAIFLSLFEFIRPYKARVIVLTVSIAVSVAAQMAIPLLTKFIVDGVLKQGDLSLVTRVAAERDLAVFAGCILLAFVVIMAGRVVGNTAMAWLSGRIVADLRESLHRKLQRLSMRYHGKRESGELIARVMNDTGELRHFLVEGVPFLLINVLSFTCIGAILLYLHPVLALFVFLPVPLLIGGGGWFWKHLVPLFHKRGNRNSVLHSTLGESIRGIRAVKALVQEDRRHAIFRRDSESLFGVVYRLERVWIRFFEVMAMVMGIGTVAVWYFGGKAILDPASSFTFGDLIAYIGYMVMFYAPLQWFTAVVNWMTHAFASAERILQVLDEPEEAYDAPDAKDLPDVKGQISFRDVRFSYDRGKEVIKGISFDIAPGTMIGLVGKSGAGKTTIINLVCRFFGADSGVITVDGNDIRDIKLQQWRRNIGIVMQDPFLFNATVLDNISYGSPEASFADVVRAARAARAHEFILTKEEGYDTIIGEGGVNLSGGERQRLAIARAILNDPAILILDEATSAIDSETERDIQEAIATLVEGRTTIAIAHRLATLRNADRLIVIEDGNIIEQGTHEELLADEDGHFSKLVRIQAENNRLHNELQAYSLE